VAKNQLNSAVRFMLQDWLRKHNKVGFEGCKNIIDVTRLASIELNIPTLAISHIRTNARILNVRLPRSYKNHRVEEQDSKRSFMCTCGRKIEVYIKTQP